MSTRRGVALVCGLLVGLGACAHGAPSGGRPDREAADQATTLADLLVQAEADGAGAAQLGVLRSAADTGTVPVGAVRASALRAVGCMRDARLDARYEEYVLEAGVVLPGWVVHRASDDGLERHLERCDRREYAWASRAYQMQPSRAVEHRTVHLGEPGA